MLQEQYWSTHMKSAPIHHAWTLIEPTAPNDTQPRSAIYINNSLLSASQITPLALPFSDITAITLITTDENTKPHLNINIYNSCDKSIIAELHEYLRNKINTHNYGIIRITQSGTQKDTHVTMRTRMH